MAKYIIQLMRWTKCPVTTVFPTIYVMFGLYHQLHEYHVIYSFIFLLGGFLGCGPVVGTNWNTLFYSYHDWYSVHIYTTDMRGAVPEAGIKGWDKYLHPTYIVGCNYLSLPLVSASGTTLLIYHIFYEHKPTQIGIDTFYLKYSWGHFNSL